MTKQEAQKAFEELKSQGYSEEDILGVLYLMFTDDKLSLEELGGMVDALGYHLNEDFENMSEEDQKTKGFELEESTDDESKEVEEAKEYKEDDEEKEEVKETKTESESKPAESKPTEEKEEEVDEEEEAAKLFGFGKKK